jgi:hypothetical protein
MNEGMDDAQQQSSGGHRIMKNVMAECEKKPKPKNKNKNKKKKKLSKKRKQVHDDDNNKEEQQRQRQPQEPQQAKKPKVVVARNDRGDEDEESSCSAAAAAELLVVTQRLPLVQRPHHAFVTNPLDHCETPLRAYEQIVGVLRMLAATNINIKNNKSSNDKNNVMIWDPYYCDGAVVQHLHSLGFANVWHENCDFYATIRSFLASDDISSSASCSGGGILPDYDIFVTNPPYSDDHIEKLFAFLNGAGAAGTTIMTNTTTTTATSTTSTTTIATRGGTEVSSGAAAAAKIPTTKPFCLLLPNWVARKRNYRELLSVSNQVVYLSPVIPYTYQMPAWNHSPQPSPPPPDATTTSTTTTMIPDHVTRANGATTPYLSSWYIYGLSDAQFDELNAVSNRNRRHDRPTDWVVAKTIKGLKWKIQQKQQQQQQQHQRRRPVPPPPPV